MHILHLKCNTKIRVHQGILDTTQMRANYGSKQTVYDSMMDITIVDKLTGERDEARTAATEYREQLVAFFDAMELVSKLAAMDSTTYCLSQIGVNKREQQHQVSQKSIDHSYFVSCEPISFSDSKENSKHNVRKQKYDGDKSNHETNSSTIQSQLENFQQHWKLEETPLPKLLSSIHRLQSHLQHAQAEADTAIPQTQFLTNDIIKYKKENEKMENAVKKLYKRNLKLKSKLKEAKKEKRSLVKTVKNYILKKREEELDKEELHVATRLKVHEKLLKLGVSRRSQCHSVCDCVNNLENAPDTLQDNDDIGIRDFPLLGNRIRTNTSETAFSELDPSFDPIHNSENESIIEDPSLQNQNILRIVKTSGISDDNRSCFSSTSTWSARSLITDESIGTVRLNSVAPLLVEGENYDGQYSFLRKAPPSYALTFPRGEDIGLQFQAIPIPMRETNVIDSLSSPINRGRSFSDGAILDILEPHAGEKKARKAVQGSLKYPSNFTFDKMFSGFHQKSTDAEGDNSSEKYLFVVSGIEGFDTALNVRPTIGGRLIAINDESLLDGDWNLDSVKRAIEQKSATSSTESSKTFTITFRNDNITKIQRDALKNTINVVGKMEEKINSRLEKNLELLVTDKFTSTTNEMKRMPMRPSAKHNQAETPASKDKASFFDMFKNTPKCDSKSGSKVEKRSNLAFFKFKSSKNDLNSNSIEEVSNDTTFFSRLNMSKKREIDSLSELSALQGDDITSRDAKVDLDTVVSKKKEKPEFNEVSKLSDEYNKQDIDVAKSKKKSSNEPNLLRLQNGKKKELDKKSKLRKDEYESQGSSQMECNDSEIEPRVPPSSTVDEKDDKSVFQTMGLQFLSL